MKIRLSPDVLALNPGAQKSISLGERQARVPKAEQDEGVGLTALLVRGWSVQSPDCVRYRLYQFGGADTGLCDSLRAACDKAKELEKELSQ